MAPAHRCPTCDVRLSGSLQHGFYCPHCNLLFSPEEIQVVGREARKGILERHFGQVEGGSDPAKTKKKRR